MSLADKYLQRVGLDHVLKYAIVPRCHRLPVHKEFLYDWGMLHYDRTGNLASYLGE